MTDTTPISGPLIEGLRAACDRDGVSAVARETGLHRTTLHRALAGKPLSLDNADRLAAWLGLALTTVVGHSDASTD